MIKGKYLAILLSLSLTVSCLTGCSMGNAGSADTGNKTEAGQEPEATAFEGYVYGEVSAVGDDTVTIRLGTIETSDEGESKEDEPDFDLTLTGQEVTIQLKDDTVIERMSSKMAALSDISAGDIVSITFDEGGYANTITALDVSRDKDNHGS